MTFKVLLIDDEPAALEGMLLWVDWEGLGFQICGTCGNGEDGLRKIRELSPDLVVTDVKMPLMDGLDMIAAWRREAGGETVRFAIVSGYSEFEYAQKAMRYGINHYLLKPVIPDEAERELQDLYRELAEQKERRRIGRLVEYEESAALLKGLLAERPVSGEERRRLERLSGSSHHWNVIVCRAEGPVLLELREEVASVSREEAPAYRIDLEDHLAVVYGMKAGLDGDVRGHDVGKRMGRYAERGASISVGTAVPSLLRIGESYRAAKEALRHAFYADECGQWIEYENVRHRPFDYRHDYTRFVKEMLQAVEWMDRTGFDQAVGKAKQAFLEAYAAPEVVAKVAVHTMRRIGEYMEEAGVFEAEWPEKFGRAGRPAEALGLARLMERLLECGLDAIDALRRRLAAQSRGIVNEINRYIEEHYREAITIKQLAQKFYLNPVYMGQLLMRKNGIGFHEQIHNLRINEAVRLLRETKLRTGEIAEHVGYGNYGLFLKQFVKRIGMPPNEFRGSSSKVFRD